MGCEAGARGSVQVPRNQQVRESWEDEARVGWGGVG